MPFYSPISSEWEFLLLHIFASILCLSVFFSFAILIGIEWSQSLWLYNVIVSSNIWYRILLFFLFAIYISSLMRCLFRYFAHFKVGFLKKFFYYCWALRDPCIFCVTVFLSGVTFADVSLLVCNFSVSWQCLSLDRAKVFNFNEVQLINYFLMHHVFGVISK